MAPKKRILSSFVSFDVLYEDGTLTSNRRVPSMALEGLDGDEPARGIIESQDRDIGLASGRMRPQIKRLTRTPVRVPAKE